MFPLNRLCSVPDACYLHRKDALPASIFYPCSRNFFASLSCWKRALMWLAVLWCGYHLAHLTAYCCILCPRHILASQAKIWKLWFDFNDMRLTSKMVTFEHSNVGRSLPVSQILNILCPPLHVCICVSFSWCSWLTRTCKVPCFSSRRGSADPAKRRGHSSLPSAGQEINTNDGGWVCGLEHESWLWGAFSLERSKHAWRGGLVTSVDTVGFQLALVEKRL